MLTKNCEDLISFFIKNNCLHKNDKITNTTKHIFLSFYEILKDAKRFVTSFNKNIPSVIKIQNERDIPKPRTFIQMNQGYIIIGLVLVAGYFAYKKFKK